MELGGHRCALMGYTRCRGELTPHRIRKGSAGWNRATAGYVPGNVVPMCEGHQVWVEDNPIDAAELGLVIR